MALPRNIKTWQALCVQKSWTYQVKLDPAESTRNNEAVYEHF